MTIYHLAQQSHWRAAQARGSYSQSTVGRTLDEEGFIHASTAEQWPLVRKRFYAAIDEPLMLLEIDEAKLTADLVREPGHPGSDELFPHVYGPIEVRAVVATTRLDPPHA
ncbi:MAG: DUF952 domain-containing protein [Terracoccus sp.]